LEFPIILGAKSWKFLKREIPEGNNFGTLGGFNSCRQAGT